jgi:hypothetical protein
LLPDFPLGLNKNYFVVAPDRMESGCFLGTAGQYRPLHVRKGINKERSAYCKL